MTWKISDNTIGSYPTHSSYSVISKDSYENIIYTILQNLTYNIYTQYESKDFLLTKLILSFCCHGNRKK